MPGATYPGDPLGYAGGTVISSGPLPSIEMVIQWQGDFYPAMTPAVVGARAMPEVFDPSDNAAPYVVQFYTRPSYGVFPPPYSVFHIVAPGEVGWARGNVAAVPKGYSDSQIQDAALNHNPAFGADVDHWIVYLWDDVPPGSLTDWYLGGSLSRGSHLLQVTRLNLACDPTGLAACEADLAATYGVTDPAMANHYCLLPYRLTPIDPSTPIVVTLGTYDPPAPDPCP
jgi:hypothetical protein